MSMGKWETEHQETLWVETQSLAVSPGHPFYERVNALLATHGFDAIVAQLCERFYAEVMGRPSVPPSVYFRMLFIGYFEGIDSERGIAWRTADSMALRSFLGYSLTEGTPDHSSLSRARHRIDLETHQAVFDWMLGVLAKEGFPSPHGGRLRARPWAWTPRRWRRMRRCVASCGAIQAKATRNF